MDVVARVQIVDAAGQPADVELGLEAYDLGQNGWRRIEDLLAPFRITPTIKREPGRYEISFSLKQTPFLKLFGATAFFRLVSAPAGEAGPAQVILARELVGSDPDNFSVDFGTVLYLGPKLGFVTAPGRQGVFCSGVALASEDARLAAAQRRFYGNPREIDQIAAERDKLREQLAASDAAKAVLQQSLDECKAASAALAADKAQLAKDLAAANRGLKACTTETGRLASQIEAQVGKLAEEEKALAVLAAERDGLGEQLAACAREREAAAARIETLTQQLAGAAEELHAALDARAKAEADLSACAKRGEALDRQAVQTAAALEACSGGKAAAEQRAVQAEGERDAASDRLAAAEAERSALAAELDDARSRTSGEQAYVGSLRDSLTAQTARAEAAAGQLEAVRAQHRTAAPAATVFQSLAGSIGEAARGLAAQGAPYRLGRADLNLKAFVGGDGGQLSLPDAAHLSADPALSDISIELIPTDPAVDDQGSGLVTPDVLGLTETAAVRVLASLFLKPQKAVEPVAAPEKFGRALRQAPKAGTPVARGDTVLVVYGAEGGA